MRHDWTLLCTEVQAQDPSAIMLGNVFTTLEVSSPYGVLDQVESVLFDPPTILVSHWTAEFSSDRRVIPVNIQLLAPGGEQVLWTERLDFDFRIQMSYCMVYIMQTLPFAGKGTYEFHVAMEQFADLGEWGRACLSISEI